MFWIMITAIWIINLFLALMLYRRMEINFFSYNKGSKTLRWVKKAEWKGGKNMPEDNCLNCRYQPDWSDWTGDKYSRCSGECKYKPEFPILPKTWVIYQKHVVRFADNSGIIVNCPAWKKAIKRRSKKA